MLWTTNPAHAVTDWTWEVRRLWASCQNGMGGYAFLPEPGGLLDQAAVVMDAFDCIAAEEARLRAVRPEGGGD